LIRIAKLQWLEQHGIHDTEDCSIGANTESKRKNCDCGKSTMLEQGPKGVAQVSAEGVHDSCALCFVLCALCLVRVAQSRLELSGLPEALTSPWSW
jgi:hypothetical protein